MFEREQANNIFISRDRHYSSPALHGETIEQCTAVWLDYQQSVRLCPVCRVYRQSAKCLHSIYHAQLVLSKIGNMGDLWPAVRVHARSVGVPCCQCVTR